MTGTGCAPATLSRRATGSNPLQFHPPVGADVGSFGDSLIVTDARLGGGQVTWTVHPAAPSCALYQSDPLWSWSTDRRPWAVTHRDSAYVIRARRRGGVRSIAGFRVDGYTRRSAPTITKARRFFGKPSSLRRSYRVACRARWNRIGLTIDFINLGGRNPCRHGYLQAGRVRGNTSPRWTAVVGRDSGVAVGTTDVFLDYERIGEPGDTDRAWTLAKVFIPYGEPGYYPSLSALLSRAGAVGGFEFWVGAGGD